MNYQNDNEPAPGDRRNFRFYPILTFAWSLLAIVATFILSTSTLDVSNRAQGFAGILALYLSVCILAFIHQSNNKRPADVGSSVKNENIERGLEALEEASRLFTGSLRSEDAFRLVSSRVRNLVPFQAIVIYLLNESRTVLIVKHAEGSRPFIIGESLRFDEGLAGQAYTTCQVETDGYMALDSEQEYRSSVAIPLRHNENVFGVMQLYFGGDYNIATEDAALFEGIGTRAAPLMLGSIAYERTQANAMTDATTDLPNERAFYLVLENQVAEAQRKRDERPLTILAIDVKNFEVINCTFGHAAGDRVLTFVGQVIKDSVRQMDFVARAWNDEFLVVLPTADKEISHEIIARIQTGFFGRKIAINETQSVELELNVGWAAFGSDGETPGQLMSFAQLRKEQSKSSVLNNVLWFPRESHDSVF